MTVEDPWVLRSAVIDDCCIRPATPDDVGIVLRMIRELAAFEHALDRVVADERMLSEQLFGERPAAEVVLAERDDEVVAFALFFHNFSTWLGHRGLYLEDLYVTPQARSAGVGRALLRYLARVAIARDCGRIEWWVLDWNEDAIRFYRELGAESQDDWTVFRLSGEQLLELAEDAG